MSVKFVRQKTLCWKKRFYPCCQFCNRYASRLRLIRMLYCTLEQLVRIITEQQLFLGVRKWYDPARARRLKAVQAFAVRFFGANRRPSLPFKLAIQGACARAVMSAGRADDRIRVLRSDAACRQLWRISDQTFLVMPCLPAVVLNDKVPGWSSCLDGGRTC